jgi:hypothetical protein
MDVVGPADRRGASPPRLTVRMNARMAPDTVRRRDDAACAAAPAPASATIADAARWVWHGPYGPIVIEVIGDSVYVDGDRVEPYRP